jgi:hypothetical protein
MRLWHRKMGIIELIGLAASLSLLAGWRLYLCLFATGLALHAQVLPLPDHLASLQILANPWVIGVSGVGAVAEFLADKVAWVDGVWDAIHTLIRPVGGALLALTIVDPADPATQVIAFLLGGGAALAAHSGKAGTRALVNTSPEPFSNVMVSAGEDVASGGLLLLAYQYPETAIAIGLFLLAVTTVLLLLARRIFKRLFAPRTGDPFG